MTGDDVQAGCSFSVITGICDPWLQLMEPLGLQLWLLICMISNKSILELLDNLAMPQPFYNDSDGGFGSKTQTYKLLKVSDVSVGTLQSWTT